MSVKPLFLVPRGSPQPFAREKSLLRRHLNQARDRYRELLGGETTFRIVEGDIDVVAAAHPLDHYRQLSGGKDASAWVAELLDHYGYTRFNCPHIYLMVVANREDRYPVGGGRPFNGGINTGGGIIVMSSYALTKMPNFQSTLQHELGHTFGLPHVDVYGYDMKTSPSLMSYNPDHKTSRFDPGRIPGRLIPEDLRALALNDRVFADLTFSVSRDVPASYRLAPRIVPLGPMEIDGRPAYAPEVTTSSGEAFNSSVSNVVAGQIPPSRGPAINFNGKTMWHSDAAANGIVTLEVTFPFAVELTGLAIHSEHSGRSHRARAARLEVRNENQWVKVHAGPLSKADEKLSFDAANGSDWRLHLQTGASRKVVLRGLRFFRGETEVVPQLVPWQGTDDS